MKKSYIIESQYDGIKVKDYASIKDINKRALKDIKMKGDILINEKHAIVNDIVHTNDTIDFIYPKEISQVIPWDYPLNIIYEDEYLLVIDKPSGIPCVPTRGHRYHTIANALKGYYDKNNIEAAIHMVNRLDKETSGLMLVAKYRDIHYAFSKDIKQVQRVYHCIVDGQVDCGTIDLPILKNEKQMKRIISDQGKPSVTHYQALRYFGNHTLVECRLETGRTHQIRVHMASIGHPLSGDSLYGSNTGEFYLDSVEIAFKHPITKEYINLKK